MSARGIRFDGSGQFSSEERGRSQPRLTLEWALPLQSMTTNSCDPELHSPALLARARQTSRGRDTATQRSRSDNPGKAPTRGVRPY